MKEGAKRDYETYCDKVARSRGMTIEEVKKLRVVQEYKKYIEEEWEGRADD